MTDATTDTLVESSSPPGKPKSRILRFDEVYDPRRMHFVEKPTAKSSKSKTSKGKKQPVLIVRRVFDRHGNRSSTKIEIHSEPLALVLREIGKEVDDIELNAVPPKTTSDVFFHYRNEIKEALRKAEQQPEPDSNLVEDLTATVEFIQEEYGVATENHDSLTRAGEITWDLLWTLFKPGSLVYHYHTLTDQDQILRFRSMNKVKDRGVVRTHKWQFQCDTVGHDGYKFGLVKETRNLTIEPFEGTRKITQLTLFPLEFHSSASEIRRKALIRGTVYRNITKPFYCYTAGAAVREVKRQWTPTTAPAEENKAHSHGRAMVDVAAYRLFSPSSTLVPAVHLVLEPTRLTETELLITTPVAYGFCFGTKEWLGLPLSRLEAVVFNQTAFSDLVVDESYKSLILALVKQHDSQKDEFDDIVRGKGKGTICLLSGPPGCGKTLTAEAAAEATGRPIYQISAGELGTIPSQVDETLTRVLNMAHHWGSILLLDEADVFLAVRNERDIHRNALVSVFLRQLEYYQGILILTTNRINYCDPAFESRIHLSLRYKELNEPARAKVWKQFLTKAAHASHVDHLEISDEDIRSLARREINGRQIKNIVSAARALAKEIDELLSMTHLNTVLDTMLAWKDERNEETPPSPPTGLLVRTDTMQSDLLV